MSSKTLFYCLLSLLMLAGAHAYAAPPSELDQVVAKIQQQYEQMQDLEADFFQEAFSQTLQKPQKAQGKLYLKKPGLMHWDYQSPEKQIIVLDGQYMWWYTPDSKQVIQQKTEQAFDSNLAITFMGGMGKMQEDFKITLVPSQKGAQEHELKLVPAKPQANIKHLLLLVDAVRYRTKRIVLHDFYGNTTTINFKNLKINQGVDENLFQFIPPTGVQIITPEDFPGGKLH